MGVSFAGVPLLLPDVDGEIQDWLDDWLPLSDSRMILEWPTAQTNFGVSPYYVGQALPQPNWSRPLRPKINTWYRPTGASRWSFGFFLAEYSRLQTILAKISSSGSGNPPQTLVLESNGHIRSWDGCYLLPPHPVSANIANPTSLWVLPIVDERWYWQFDTGYLTPIDATAPTDKTWAQMFSAVATGLGINLTVDTVPTQYLYPNRFFISGTSWHNGGILLDALAHSVGQRIIPAYQPYGANTPFTTGNWISANWGRSQNIRTANLTGQFDLGTLQVGQLGAFPAIGNIAPAGLIVSFRIYKNGIVIGDWKDARYQSPVTAAAANYGGDTNSGFTKTILSTALADISSGGNPLAPDNQATLDALALQIAQDFYAGLWVQDSAVVGVSQWQESGYDDYIEFNLGRPDEIDGQPRTRIHSVPYNKVMERMLHYDTTTWEYGERISGTLDGNLVSGGSQTITLGTVDGAKPSGTTHLTVTSIVQTTGSTGDHIEAFRFGDVWGVNGTASGGGGGTGSADLVTGQTSAMVLAGASGTFTLDAAFGGGTVVAQVDKGICFASPDPTLNTISYQIGKMKDGTYQVINPTRLFWGQFSAQVNSTVVWPPPTGTFTIFSGNSGGELTTGSSVTAVVKFGSVVPNTLYLCSVTAINTYEIIDDNMLLPCRVNTASVVGNTPTGGGTTVAVQIDPPQGVGAQTVNATLSRGIMVINHAYLLGNASPLFFTSFPSGLNVINPTMLITGITNALINSGATGNVTTDTTDLLVITGVKNNTDQNIPANHACTIAYNEPANIWVIISAQ